MTVLFYCQHSLGMGHFVRSIALADRLADRFDVVFLNGGALPAGLSFPSRVERVDLPAIGMNEAGALVSLDARYSVDASLEARLNAMLTVLRARRPDVLLIELFPFGRKKFERELIPLVESARQLAPASPLVVSSVRDLLVTGRADQQRFDDRARILCDRYFDLVLVHADPALASFDESFRPATPLRTPVRHTGFIARHDPPAAGGPRDGVLVSAGGGLVGDALFRAAVAAHRLNWDATGMRTTIVAGPFAPAATLAWLQEAERQTSGLHVIPHVPDLRPLLARTAVSVSQCGYNTALDIASTAAPALVVPYGDGQENEQTRRAERLAARGVLRWLPAADASAPRLAAAISEMRRFTPAASGLRMNGAAETVSILRHAVAQRQLVTAGGAR